MGKGGSRPPSQPTEQNITQTSLPDYYEPYATRLIQRAEEIFLIYSSNKEGVDRGEKSRFIYQLEIENQDLHIVPCSPFLLLTEPRLSFALSAVALQSACDNVHT